MEYRQLGKAGIRLSALSFGSWLTFGDQVGFKEAKSLMHFAFDQGVNFFDNAEGYGHGQAEIIMGDALKSFRREDLVISTKIFWGGKGINDQGLSRKHLIEGTKNSLKRFQLDYVDLLYCHRPDPMTPIEETVCAMNDLIRGGYALYWGTSEWSAEQIDMAYKLSYQLHCIPPSMEQPRYNMFYRHRVEQEYVPLYSRHGMGITTWSPLSSGLLSGKYNFGLPSEARLTKYPQWRENDMEDRLEIVGALIPIAQELDCTLAQLAIAWCLKNPHVSSVILGATKEAQLSENLGAIHVVGLLDDNILKRIDTIFAAAPHLTQATG
jgi:voltage-dependent potassium channel beta subunit